MAINYQSSKEAADAACAHARECGVFAQTYQADVSHQDEADAMVEKIGKDFGRIDVLVNNAGITRDKSFLKMTKMLWDEVLGVNLTGPLQRYARHLAGHGGGRLGTHREHRLDRGADGQFRTGELRRHQGRADRLHHDLGARSRPQGHYRQRRVAGFIDTDMVKDMPRGRPWMRSRP